MSLGSTQQVVYTKNLVYLHFYTLNRPKSILLQVLIRKNEGKIELRILQGSKVRRVAWHGQIGETSVLPRIWVAFTAESLSFTPDGVTLTL